MTHYAIIEQHCIHKNGKQSDIYDKDVTGHVCVFKRTYRLEDEFDQCIEDACAELSKVAEDLPKVLVISAHGHEFSGNLMIPGQKVDGISLWNHFNAFKPIPNQTVVHLSSCFGAYPNAIAIQSASHNDPPIIGPLVNISFNDAMALHTALLNHINVQGVGDAVLREFVDEQHQKLSIHDPYFGRYVVGLIDRTGSQHPEDAVGNQLAAAVENNRIIFVVESVDYSTLNVKIDTRFTPPKKSFEYDPGDDAKGFWLHVPSGGRHNRLRVPLGDLGDFIDNAEYEAICGRQFSSLYQVTGVYGEYGEYVHANLLEVRAMDGGTSMQNV